MSTEIAPTMPRIWRDRVSREMAFPVGYEFLREHFGAVVDAPETGLWFRARPARSAPEFAAYMHKAESYPILRVERRPQIHRNDETPARWEFTIHPVPSRLRSVARAALVAGSLVEMQRFVACCPIHANYYNQCLALFDPVEGTCKTDQLHPLGNASKVERPPPSLERPQRAG